MSETGFVDYGGRKLTWAEVNAKLARQMREVEAERARIREEDARRDECSCKDDLHAALDAIEAPVTVVEVERVWSDRQPFTVADVINALLCARVRAARETLGITDKEATDA
jgi:hypothetical protein